MTARTRTIDARLTTPATAPFTLETSEVLRSGTRTRVERDPCATYAEAVRRATSINEFSDADVDYLVRIVDALGRVVVTGDEQGLDRYLGGRYGVAAPEGRTYCATGCRREATTVRATSLGLLPRCEGCAARFDAAQAARR